MLYQLYSRQAIHQPLEVVWPFFLRPENLSKITPPDMGFEIRSRVPRQMYPGLIITYTVRPLWGIAVEWVTEITHLKPPSEGQAFFVDEQRRGPYALWHHEHHFREEGSATLMEDIVHYALPFGFIGGLVHPQLIRPRLLAIFRYRGKAIQNYFGAEPAEIQIRRL